MAYKFWILASHLYKNSQTYRPLISHLQDTYKWHIRMSKLIGVMAPNKGEKKVQVLVSAQ